MAQGAVLGIGDECNGSRSQGAYTNKGLRRSSDPRPLEWEKEVRGYVLIATADDTLDGRTVMKTTVLCQTGLCLAGFVRT